MFQTSSERAENMLADLPDICGASKLPAQNGPTCSHLADCGDPATACNTESADP